MKQKQEMMQKLRKDRAAKGLKRCEFWLTAKQKERVKKYVARLQKSDA